MKMQCEAVTLVSTYSESHRCLKTKGILKTGQRRLCAHHRMMEERRSSASDN